MRKTLAFLIVLVTMFGSLVSANAGEEKYVYFLAALMGNEDKHIVFSQSEAVAVINAGAHVMFEDMPSVSAYCNDVVLRGNLIDVATAVTVAGMTVHPRVTLTARVEGEDVILELKRMRVGILPMSITAFLTAIRAVGCPEYMQVHPLSGKVVIRKRGYVRYLDSIDVTPDGIEVFVLGR